jgi:SPP1 gp7 family putative phage head morphogenesis protein
VSCCLVHNTRKSAIRRKNPLRYDPTRTGLIRNKFQAEVRLRFGRLRKAVKEFILVHDALGLKRQTQPKGALSLLDAPLPPSMRQRQYAFLTDDKKLAAFQAWLRQQIGQDITVSGPWTNQYIESAYKKGVLNAYLAAKRDQLAAQGDFAQMSQEQFLRDSFAPDGASKVALLATRAWENMRGVTDTIGTQMNQILSQGMIDGSGAQDIADEMTDKIDSLTDTRALVIARTELIHSHAEGQLDSFEELGVQQLGVDVEWSVTEDGRQCPECEDMDGKTFTVDDARGLIPLHPNCRCSWIPAEPDSKK